MRLAQDFAHAAYRPLTDAVRERWNGLAPLSLVTRVASTVRRELDVQRLTRHIVVIVIEPGIVFVVGLDTSVETLSGEKLARVLRRAVCPSSK